MSRQIPRLLTALVVAVVLASAGTPPAAQAGPVTICYVDWEADGGDNDGTSWVDAYWELQSALGNASCNEIWVAEGVYSPGGNKADTFQINPGVAVYGGFAGTETTREQRNWKLYITVLSGDIFGDDTVDAHGIVIDYTGIAGSNNYHVVTMDGTGTPVTSSTVLDGLAITGGHADNAATEDDIGGGLLCLGAGSGHACSPTLARITFSGNYALEDGGALYNDGSTDGVSSPSITECFFTGNHADSTGGAIQNGGDDGGNSSPAISYSEFFSNSAVVAGGAIYNNGSIGNSSPTLTDVYIHGCSAVSGGAMFSDGTSGVSSPTLTRVRLYSNSAVFEGGAILNYAFDGTSSPSLYDVTFYDNSTMGGGGGGMYNMALSGGVSIPTITRALFWYNRSPYAGGAIYDAAETGGTASPNLSNVTFTQNQATTTDPLDTTSGGAMFNIAVGPTSTAYPVLTNVSFFNNSSDDYGGAITNVSTDAGTANIALTNAILWADSAGVSGPEVENSGTSTYFNRSVIEGGCPAGSTCTDILTTDPRLGALADHGGYSLTMDLMAGSSAINTANDGSCPTTDQRHLVRPQGAHCDIGAFEVRNGARADFDGEGVSDMGYFHPSTGQWAILHSYDGFSYAAPQYITWGQAGDIILPADFDGDSMADPAVRRPPSGGQCAAYMILTSTTGYDYGSALTIPGGWPGLGDTPVVGDFTGDGVSEPAIWRGNTGVWIIPHSRTFVEYSFHSWGQSGDTPIAADVDGDGQTDIGYWRPSTGVWGFLLSTEDYSYASPQFFNWGTSGDIPVMADYDGDGLADPAVVIPPAGGQSRAYRILLSSLAYDPAHSVTIPAGWPGLNDTPVPGDYDNDGKADAGIWRANTGVWIIPKSSTNNTQYIFAAWGASGDVPAR